MPRTLLLLEKDNAEVVMGGTVEQVGSQRLPQELLGTIQVVGDQMALVMDAAGKTDEALEGYA